MTTTAPVTPPGDTPTRRTGRWIDDWRPEEEEFWEGGGKQVARRNLIWSIFAEHLGFSVWLIWSVSSAFLVAQGFSFTPQQLFFLVAIPNLVGSLLRVPYTLAVGKLGGRNWTMVSAALLLVPTIGFAFAVTNPATPYWAFCLIAATAGFGGGNFSSSMANINFFYPASKKGAALGLNAAGGNIGVSLIQFFLPLIVGGAAIFGLVKVADGGIHLERAAFVYAALAVTATLAAFFFMDNLGTAKTDTRSQRDCASGWASTSLIRMRSGRSRLEATCWSSMSESFASRPMPSPTKSERKPGAASARRSGNEHCCSVADPCGQARTFEDSDPRRFADAVARSAKTTSEKSCRTARGVGARTDRGTPPPRFLNDARAFRSGRSAIGWGCDPKYRHGAPQHRVR